MGPKSIALFDLGGAMFPGATKRVPQHEDGFALHSAKPKKVARKQKAAKPKVEEDPVLKQARDAVKQPGA